MTPIQQGTERGEVIEPEPGSTEVVAMSEQGLTIAITVTEDGWTQAVTDIENACIEAAHAALVDRVRLPAEVSLVLTDDAQIRDLNSRFRDKDNATNVLSFPNAWSGPDEGEPDPESPDEGHGSPALLGDVVLALQTISREAAEQGKSMRDHACHLVVHGCLHLIGFDHEGTVEAAEMEGLETQLMARMDIADPYLDREPA
jgi:probable rRNA maturation factor